MTVEYRVLGPLEVLLDGEPVPVPAGRGRVLLATLLLRANEFVSVDELVERVWDGEPPAADRAHKTLQTVVMRLRQSLGEANCVRTSSRGYSAEVEPEQLDLTRFRALTALGERRAALELWRGPVLGNVASESLHREDVPQLVEEHVVALERRIDEDLARVTDVLVPELRSLVRQHPLRETFWAQLMLALHRAGQQAEALTVYQEIRTRLADELGVDPGQRLREAHEQVLRGEAPASSVVPRQLPPAHPHFVGREHELARLTEMLRIRPGEPVLISAINGIGGVGKTALALRWAHQVADRFPDGQLYANLRGFDTRAEPLDPVSVTRDFLLALGVPTKEIPASDDAVIAMYRSVLAQRRALVVLDNARDVDQVRPLLPGGAANLVLITSRNRLSGLVAREGAQPVALDVLDQQGAVDLLTERIGAARVAAEPDAVSRLVKRCAGLPLALGIVAARAAYGDSLTALADELEQERLDALDIDDPMTGIRGVFSWSLRSVSEPAARVFVLLGLHPGPDFSIAAAASLAALSPAEARRALNELVACSLVGAANTGRFALHDLLRDYVQERAAELPDEQRLPARQRMFDHYVHMTWAACVPLEGAIRWPELPPPAEFAVVEPIADVDASYGWYEPEHQVLLGVFAQLEAVGADDVLWTYAYSLHNYLLRSSRLGEAADIEARGLAAAQREGSVFGQSRLNRALAGAYMAARDLVKAEFHMGEGLRCDEELGDENGVSNVSRGLAFLCELQGKHDEGLAVLRRIHPMAVNLKTKFEKASYLSAYGRAHHLVGDNERALELCLDAQALYVELNRPAGDVSRSMNHETLADIYTALGRHADAIENCQASVRMLRAIRDIHNLADVLVQLSKAQIAAGDPDAARESLDEALSLCERMEAGNANSQRVRELLASLD
ncbi:tetratricopeptide repeat protein [Lentzea sp. PSKA42]|uniref:Tetratricopeptide repeat protein n=1 Tax=Lentzea indica TaxID=2604800 RepID=A0ABX1FH33_9PSEU|nr:AfsR/SARP family transcriptional regulator [Lentzea indica]NKE57913.1 tetratricopeptide repeat protein [Lentzea indica]